MTVVIVTVVTVAVVAVTVLTVALMTVTDVNINYFQDKFAGYGIYRFCNLPA